MNLDLRKYANVKVVGTVVALVLIFLLWRNGRRWWVQLTRTDAGNYSGQTPVESNPDRKAELNQLARDTFTAIHSTLFLGGVTPTGREWQLEKLLQLNDTELRYVAQYYQDHVNQDGTSLRQDITDEWMPMSDVKPRLIAKLTQLAL